MVHEHAVVLLGHRAVEGSQPRFHVHERHAGGVRGEGTGQRRVRVALHHDGPVAVPEQQLLHAGGRGGDLLSARAAPDVELRRRRGKTKRVLELGRELG